MLFTVIYTDCRLIGSHMNTQVCMAHLKTKKGETILQALERKGLECAAIFVFLGHLESLPDFSFES